MTERINAKLSHPAVRSPLLVLLIGLIFVQAFQVGLQLEVTEGGYQISQLKKEYQQLSIELAVEQEKLYEASSLIVLEQKATAMGMMPSENIKFISIKD